MRCALLLWLLVVLFLCCQSAVAATSPEPIEGMILVSAYDEAHGIYSYLIEGMSDHVTPAGAVFSYGKLSPHMDRVTYQVADGWPATVSDVWTARIDGSDAFNVTGLAGIGGVNCKPAWSPDARQIAFQHADPSPDLLPCDGRFHVWVINADGTGAHRVTRAGTAMTWDPAWSPDGFRLLCTEIDVGTIAVDADGTDLAALANVQIMADWSPDGKHIASATCYEGEYGGEIGAWRGLVLTNADGSDPQVLFERFLSYADVSAHIALYGPQMVEGKELEDVREGVGPSYPDWSPLGDRILFRAALPFNPQGLFYPYQNDLWLYDLGTGDLTNITENAVCEFGHSWNGPNTFPDDPEVTVGNVTVTFSGVGSPGVTTILRDDDPPEVPTGYLFDYEFYELDTTAQVTGPATICMSYEHPGVPEGAAEDQLAILHYNEALQAWEDITTSRDPVGNVVCGQTDTLSPVAFYGIRERRFQDVPAWGYGALGLDPQWAYYQIMACAKAGIVSGYSGGLYQPDWAVTRDQMAVFIARAMNGGDPTGPATVTFTDITNPWANVYIAYCVDHGVVQGYDATHYEPSLPVTRDQMAVFVARSQGWVVIGEDMTQEAPAFEDVPLGNWAGKAIKECVDHGVVQGYDPTHYRPEDTVTRDQMAVYVARAFGLL